ncbi:MAG: type I restriction-modification system subunit M [Actinomycetota bacterium]|nr:type I restriction-modification system subunit M [Actinomycetota bacterium]
MNASNGHVQFIWSIAELLRGDYKRSEYGQVVLPFTVLRRLDLVLAQTKQQVLEEAARAEGVDFDADALLRKAAGQRFYNTSPLDLAKVAGDANNAATSLRAYMAGFSPVVREIFDAFNFDQQITLLHRAKLLYRVLGKFLDPKLELHPDKVSNAQMGDIFEELIRRFSEASNETAGEHFTPREVVHLCARLVLAGDAGIARPGTIRKVYDPACGTGGMLSVTDELVRELNPRARLYLFGQERNPESWAICRSEMLLKGQDPSNIFPRSTLSEDGLPDDRFDLMLANPPFGVDWTKDHKEVIEERDGKGDRGRFGAGTPPKGDGALLFLQTMLAKRKPADEGGSRIAIVFNGSPLFSGGAGSGPSNIRKWILENDWLEAIVALPEQLFYNTGIASYVWVLTNRKAPERQGLVQLIDARELWVRMRKSLGEKRREISDEQVEEITTLHGTLVDGERVKVRPNDFFAYRRVTVDRPLRGRWVIDKETWAEVEAEGGPLAKTSEESRPEVAGGLRAMPAATFDDEEAARAALRMALLPVLGKVGAPVIKALAAACFVRDEDTEPFTDKKGRLIPDPTQRETETIPWTDDVGEYMEREVLPWASDAYVDDLEGRKGYEIPLTRLFHKPVELRPSEEIKAEIRELEQEFREAIHAVLA